MKVKIGVLFALWNVLTLEAAVPTAEEYTRALESRFNNGEPAASIGASFATNELFDIYEILP